MAEEACTKSSAQQYQHVHCDSEPCEHIERLMGTCALLGCLQAFWNAVQEAAAACPAAVAGAAWGGWHSRLREGCSCPLAMYWRSCSVVQPAQANRSGRSFQALQ